MVRAFPCPVGQFRLAYVAGSADDTGYLLTLTLYWAPVESLTAQIAGVEEVKDGGLCRCAMGTSATPGCLVSCLLLTYLHVALCVIFT